MEKYQNKYRIPSARLQGYNYANAGMYFITICTANREHYFGNIVDVDGCVGRDAMHCVSTISTQYKKMQLSEIGKIAQAEWHKTLKIRPDMNLQLDAFVVMPNHIHGIIIIGENEYNNGGDDGPPPTEYKNQFAPQSKNLASIIRGYKSSVTKQARVFGFEFNWQTRFHEHIIRNEKSFQKIHNYIINNPENWKDDKFNIN